MSMAGFKKVIPVIMLGIVLSFFHYGRWQSHLCWGSNSLPKASPGFSIVRTNVTTDTDLYLDWSPASNNGNPQTK